MAQLLCRLTRVQQQYSVFSSVYFIPVSYLISISVPAVTHLRVQPLDLMAVTWCWLCLWCACILDCLWCTGQFRSNTSRDEVHGVVFSGWAESIYLPELCGNYCIPLPLRILWLKAKSFQHGAGDVLSPSVADWVHVELICFWQSHGKPHL